MADFVYNEGAESLLDGTIDWAADTIKARLIASSATPNKDDDDLATGYTAIGTDQTLGSKTRTKNDTLDRIVYDAADAVFVQRGIDGARMQDIADQAGVNKALLHYHFRSKADFARAVWLRIASSFVPGVFQMLGSDISLDEKIERFVDAYHTRLARHPYLLGYVISERRDILISSMTSTRRSDGRPHDGRLSAWNSRSTNAPSGKRSRLSRLISSS